MLASGASQQCRQYSISALSLYAMVGGAALVLLSSLFFGASFLGHTSNLGELERLRQENARLITSQEKLRWEMADVSSKFDNLVDKEIALRAMFDLPEINPQQRMLGIGGPETVPMAITSRADELVYQSESDLDRLNRLARFELAKFDEVYESLSEKKRRLDHTPSIMPTKGWFSRGYGMKPNPFTGNIQHHNGLDIAGHRGEPLIATADGKIIRSGRNGGMGKMIVIDHGFGYRTRYGHMDKLMVKVGNHVKRGDVIGLLGSTGYSTGPHVHYEVIKNGKSQNPYRYILDINY